jgi:hypothetical protein
MVRLAEWLLTLAPVATQIAGVSSLLLPTRLFGLLFVLPMRCVQSALRPVDSLLPPLALLLQGSFFLRALTRAAPDLGRRARHR